MVGTLTLVAVRQQQHHVGELAPLGLTGGDELVDDRLRAVDEVTELRLPQHQCVGVAQGVAVLEADRGVLAQRRVVHREPARVLRADVVQRGVLDRVDPVDDDRVTLGEGAATRILTGQAHIVALVDQRTEGEQLGEGPVDLALVGHLATLLQHRLHARVHVETVGSVQERVADALQHRLVHRGDDGGGHLLIVLDRLRRLGNVLLQLADLVEHALQLTLVVAQRVLGLLHGDVATADQRFGVGLTDRTLGVDDVVHLRLGHRGVVALVVPAAAVADEVDDDVLAELLAEVDRETRDPVASLRVVTVDVEDRRADELRDVGGVLGGAAVLRRRGEADLVVHHDVDGAADAVTTQTRQVQRLGDHALTGERGVTVQHQRHHREAVGAVALVEQVLLGADQTLQHGVDRLEV